MNLKDIKKVYFLGIGGIGMSALARYFKSLGAEVSGYDKTSTALTDQLIVEGINVTFEDNSPQTPKGGFNTNQDGAVKAPFEGLGPEFDLVIYTPAIPKDHKGFNFYKDNNYNLKKRSEILGIISADKFSICVAGSHGKTTVSAMIAHILTESGFGCSAFLGGIATNYNSNYIQHSPQTPKGGISSLSLGEGRGEEAVNAPFGGLGAEVVVIEADEFDRSFHRLAPDMAVITAIDTDHLDIYGSKEKIQDAFVEFTEKIAEDGFLVIKQGTGIDDRLPSLDTASYSLMDTTADVHCSKYWVVDGGYLFTIRYYDKEYIGFRLNIGGFHNIENAIAAFIIAKELKISNEHIKAALASFKGIKRRFEMIVNTDKVVYIDDYAHHPEEIRVFLESVREIYPDRKITAIFQPHLFSRTKDLAAGFAEQLSIADEVILLDIYPARELPMEGVTSDLIFSKLTSKEKSNIKKEELLNILKNKKLDVVVTIGAGDIDKLVQPIKELLTKTNSHES